MGSPSFFIEAGKNMAADKSKKIFAAVYQGY
jgi:hypothetical protein